MSAFVPGPDVSRCNEPYAPWCGSPSRDDKLENQLANRCLIASANRSVASSGVKCPVPLSLSKE
jgi:hypothetical protein